MKATFNATCERCGNFKPRCALIYFRRPTKATEYLSKSVAACEDCRKQLHGKYRLDDRHKGRSAT